MSWEQIQTTLVGLAVSAIVGLVGRWFGWKVSAEQQRQAQWAIEQGVAYAAQKLKGVSVTGEAKHREATRVAESLAPKAMAKLNDAQKVVLVDSTYAKMKASLPHSTQHASHGDDIPVDVVTNSRVGPLPPPTRVPRP